MKSFLVHELSILNVCNLLQYFNLEKSLWKDVKDKSIRALFLFFFHGDIGLEHFFTRPNNFGKVPDNSKGVIINEIIKGCKDTKYDFVRIAAFALISLVALVLAR